MAEAMVNIYERVLDRPRTMWGVGVELADALSLDARDALLSASGPGLGEAAPTAPRAPTLTGAQRLSLLKADEAKTAGVAP